MTRQLDNYSDAQIARILEMLSQTQLSALLGNLNDVERDRLTRNLSETTREFLRRSKPLDNDGSGDAVWELLEKIANGDMPCTFCRILDGELPGSFVYRDDNIAVIMDLYPIAPGHMLVIPTRHVEFLDALDESTAMELMRVARRCGSAVIKSNLSPDGFNLFLANRGAGGQDVFHVHLHVLARYFGDGFGMKFPEGYPAEAGRSELDAIAETLAHELRLLTV